MSSNSLIKWTSERSEALDEIENAHVMVGGSERGRRYATQQINYSFTALLCSHFQGFCRDLHSECVDHIVSVVPPSMQRFFRHEFAWNRSLDKGNPSPGAIGSDFNRLGVEFWLAVYALDSRNERRRELLEELVAWRNAIVHQDFDPLGTWALHLARVRAWRSAINVLARSFEQAMFAYLQPLTGGAPW